jgi:hypothetical protein
LLTEALLLLTSSTAAACPLWLTLLPGNSSPLPILVVLLLLVLLKVRVFTILALVLEGFQVQTRLWQSAKFAGFFLTNPPSVQILLCSPVVLSSQVYLLRLHLPDLISKGSYSYPSFGRGFCFGIKLLIKFLAFFKSLTGKVSSICFLRGLYD